MTMFWTPFWPRFRKSDPDPLPLSARVASLEGDMLELREQGERQYGVLKKLTGKVYRGIQLGDTVDAGATVPADGNGEDLAPPPQFSTSKRELYQRAANLRRK